MFIFTLHIVTFAANKVYVMFRYETIQCDK